MQQDIKVNVNVQNLISCFFFTFVVSRDLGIRLCTFTFPFISSLLFLHSSGILSLSFTFLIFVFLFLYFVNVSHDLQLLNLVQRLRYVADY